MASSQQVRAYLAYWFQLGKPIVFQRSHSRYLPNPIFHHHTYSDDFENCWRAVEAVNGQDCYLEGTDQTIAELLSSRWDISNCARCVMPIPMAVGPIADNQACPCQDLPHWPNTDAPSPRAAINTSQHLGNIRDRLQTSYDRSAGLPNPNKTQPPIFPPQSPKP